MADEAKQIRSSAGGWKLNLRIAELVGVRSDEAILATLDDNARA
jgi:hypothetical protein